MTGFVGAVQFLTRVPVRLPAAAEHARVVPWFPLVGTLIGLVTGAVAAGLGEVLPPPVSATVAVVVGLLITGAFHEDGLADTADAFGGGWTVERRLEIMKDPRHGTYGVAAMCGSIVLRAVSAGSITDQAALFVAFVAAHTLGRAAAVVAIGSARPAADSGLGVTAARAVRPAPAGFGLLAGTAIVTVATGWWVLPFVGIALVGAAAVVALAVRKIDGLTGDVLGAVEQVVECLVLVVAAGLAARHAVWWS